MAIFRGEMVDMFAHEATAEKHKSDILNAWIMVERLSEGDIKTSDSKLLTFKDLVDEDYHGLFSSDPVREKCGNSDKGGLVVYFGIFKFDKVIDLIRKRYNLKSVDEDIQTGKKFRVALYFDRSLKLQSDKTFVSESSFILKNGGNAPSEKEFRDYEDQLKKELDQGFEGAENDKDKFNEAIRKLIEKLNEETENLSDDFKITSDNCYMQPVGNLDIEATNLHSFFCEDLEKAKKIDDSENLRLYLFGGRQGNRKNLDSKSDSQNFNPGVFEEILSPENYPLGRFPSKTEYALSLMQQVAVNLATGYDNQQIRSVNGPPGTGKTTLLKDIFADLVVDQAYEMSRLSNPKIQGTEKYYKDVKIGAVPTAIADNGIVVASSNNGAVKNIVDELPLKSGIDEDLIDELEKADYFYDIANSPATDDGDKEPGQEGKDRQADKAGDAERYWGLFSMEGGSSANMSKLIGNVKRVYDELTEGENIPPADVYKKFAAQYREVAKKRDAAKQWAEKLSNYHSPEYYDREYEELSEKLEAAKAEQDDKKNALMQEFKRYEASCKQSLAQIAQQLEGEKQRERSLLSDLERNTALLDAAKSSKPGLLAGREKKRRYESDIAEIREKLLQINSQVDACKRQQKEIAGKEKTLNGDLRIAREATQRRIDQEQSRVSRIERQMRQTKQQAEEAQRTLDAFQESGVTPLDMSLPYDELQLSNPWFSEEYRIAQSRLFISALQVRKRFLYDNRKNIKAALNIWNFSSKYVDRTELISMAFDWINLVVPVISSTFASFGRMCKYLGSNSLGHLFIDEAGQALPQAGVGAIFRSRHVMAVGDPSQIKPVLTLDSVVLGTLATAYGVGEKYLSDSASVQTLVDAASQYGFYREQDKSDESWIGIPLWVHRRCKDPMFNISNRISYGGLMVQGNPGDGKVGWYDITGSAQNKYVKEQGEFLKQALLKMGEENEEIFDKSKKDVVYVISPFAHVARELSKQLGKIKFTRREHNKVTNVGTIHTFQGKEAPIVFLVLGADSSSKGAAQWAVGEANMMNVAATRAKKEFYIIGDKKLYKSLDSDVVRGTLSVIGEYRKDHPDLVREDPDEFIDKQEEAVIEQGGSEAGDSPEARTTDDETSNPTPEDAELSVEDSKAEPVSSAASNKEAFSWGKSCSLYGRDKLAKDLRNSSTANKLMREAGLIEKTNDGWVPTEKGRQIGIREGSFDNKPRCEFTPAVFEKVVQILEGEQG
jgi:hypothetical protein